MGGEILELMSDRIAAAEKEARQRGLEEGREEGQSDMAERLRELGVAEELITQALDSGDAQTA